jgi:pilus assembly protein CpaC
MRSRHAPPTRFTVFLVVAVSLFALLPAGAQTSPPRDMTIMTGKGELLQFDRDVLRVVVAEPKIADAVVVSPRDVMINAKGPGKTTVIIWENGAIAARYNISVTPDNSDFDTFRREFRDGFPDSTVSIAGNADMLVLTGAAKDMAQSKRAAALASTRAKNVVNLLQTPPDADPRQILLQVRFASIDRVALSELGFNLISTNPKGIGSISTQQFSQPRFSQLQNQNGDTNTPTANFSDLLNLFVFRPDLNIGATIRALQGRNLLQILAEPNLIALEGSEASFLAGGEFPFPTLTATTTGGSVAPVVTVQFKKFGVQLGFTPTITPSGSIHLKVRPEVSALDFANAVTLQGFLIPAVSTRRAETEVILKDGESFAIAGLIDNRVIEILNRVKGLGDIPILGQLFRSRSTKKTTDELLVVITPHFVRPLSPDEKAKLPDMSAAFLPTIAEENEKKAAKKNKKSSQDPAFVGPRGHQEPK